MQGGEAHPLLAQIPLTVSPFISLPTAPTLPYTYKSLPSTLPPSSTSPPPPQQSSKTSSSSTGPTTDKKDSTSIPKPKFIISSSGHAAHPDEIIESCRKLQAHLTKMQDEAENTLRQWKKDIEERELAEKRRVAPGWLDRSEKILEPAKKGAAMGAAGGGGGGGGHVGSGVGKGAAETSLMDSLDDDGGPTIRSLTQERDAEGEALDRAFGGMGLR
ncbi:hypothetical protein MMC25_008119 [Agyrium rufum]|nr:hypothetical protein [Agyrium rufum]